MKSVLVFFIFCVAVSQINGVPDIRVSIYYHNHGYNCQKFFRHSLPEVLKDPILREKVYFDFVPFGLNKFTEYPPSVECYDTNNTCVGNVMNACFFARHQDNRLQAEFLVCCFATDNPAQAGEMCAKKLGVDFSGVMECMNSEEGLGLHIMYAMRTVKSGVLINKDRVAVYIPSFAIDNVYIYEEQFEAFHRLREVIYEKLRAKGVCV